MFDTWRVYIESRSRFTCVCTVLTVRYVFGSTSEMSKRLVATAHYTLARSNEIISISLVRCREIMFATKVYVHSGNCANNVLENIFGSVNCCCLLLLLL